MIGDDTDAQMPDESETPAFSAPLPEPPLAAYRAALQRYDQTRLMMIHRLSGGAEVGASHKIRPDWVVERLSEHRIAERLLSDLPTGSKIALGLFALTESYSWSAPGLHLALGTLGVEPDAAIHPLLERGLLAFRDPEAAPNPAPARFLAHPAAINAARTLTPEGDPPGPAGPVRQVRESDGLEPIIRMAAVWQRVAESPLRQTIQRTFFKRDRERIEDDPVIAGPISDAFEPLPDMALLWIELARSVGLLADEPGTDRIIAASPGFWSENAVHLPQMIATRWLGLRNWHEQGGMIAESSLVEPTLPYLRPVAMLWLARGAEDDWMALEDLAAHLDSLAPGWHYPTLSPSRQSPPSPDRAGVLASILLGPAYQLGLVRTAEEISGGRRVVQLTPLGRYVMALGPPPPGRTTFDHFLFVQPNFEVIAYRQGLTPALIGEFSRFARWTQIGSALELKLTPESIYQGLEGGLTPDAMTDRLAKHSQRAIPPSVADAVNTWASRRERVTYHASATLVEFANDEDLLRAVAEWPIASGSTGPIRISDRLLLVEDPNTIPFARFRLAGQRDYRRAPDPCVEVEADGVTLDLDLGRSDLLVDAELARFADELSPDQTRRRFRVSAASLARAREDAGLTSSSLSRWFLQRTGEALPAAIRLLLYAVTPKVDPIEVSRPMVLTVPDPDLLDGLHQHPDTSPYLGDRLGPTSAIVRESCWPALKKILQSLGLRFVDSNGSH